MRALRAHSQGTQNPQETHEWETPRSEGTPALTRVVYTAHRGAEAKEREDLIQDGVLPYTCGEAATDPFCAGQG